MTMGLFGVSEVRCTCVGQKPIDNGVSRMDGETDLEIAGKYNRD